MRAQRRIAGALIAAAIVVALLVLVDIDGTVRGVTVLVFILFAPGFALSLLMGPMSGEARALVAVAGSVSMTTIVSLLLLLAGVWSGATGSIVLAAIVCALAWRVLRRTARDGEPNDERDRAIADPEIPPARRTT